MNPELEKLAGGASPLSRLIGDEPRPVKVVPFPGERGQRSGVKVGLWNLVDWETRKARLEAIKYLTEVQKLTDVHLLQDTSLAKEETTVQLLFQAMRDADEPMRAWWPSVNTMRTTLTPDEREALFAEYLTWVDERSPLKHVHSSEELDGLVELLGKGSTAETSLSYYDTVSLRAICAALGRRCAALTRLLASGGSSPDGSPTNSLVQALTGNS